MLSSFFFLMKNDCLCLGSLFYLLYLCICRIDYFVLILVYSILGPRSACLLLPARLPPFFLLQLCAGSLAGVIMKCAVHLPFLLSTSLPSGIWSEIIAFYVQVTPGR